MPKNIRISVIATLIAAGSFCAMAPASAATASVWPMRAEAQSAQPASSFIDVGTHGDQNTKN